jgi:hypothetical protein
VESLKDIKATTTALDTITAVGGGIAKDKAARFEARQYRQRAKAVKAKGTREAQEELRKGRILASNVRATQAGAGGVTTDAGAIEQLGKVKQVTDYNVLQAIFESETASDSLKLKARVRKSEGQDALLAGHAKGISTVLGSSTFQNYLKKKKNG